MKKSQAKQKLEKKTCSKSESSMFNPKCKISDSLLLNIKKQN